MNTTLDDGPDYEWAMEQARELTRRLEASSANPGGPFTAEWGQGAG
jgi:hypothetical protein